MPQESTARKFKAVVTWEDSELDPAGSKEDAASALKEWVNEMDSEIIHITTIENLEEL